MMEIAIFSLSLVSNFMSTFSQVGKTVIGVVILVSTMFSPKILSIIFCLTLHIRCF